MAPLGPIVATPVVTMIASHKHAEYHDQMLPCKVNIIAHCILFMHVTSYTYAPSLDPCTHTCTYRFDIITCWSCIYASYRLWCLEPGEQTVAAVLAPAMAPGTRTCMQLQRVTMPTYELKNSFWDGKLQYLSNYRFSTSSKVPDIVSLSVNEIFLNQVQH